MDATIYRRKIAPIFSARVLTCSYYLILATGGSSYLYVFTRIQTENPERNTENFSFSGPRNLQKQTMNIFTQTSE